MNTAPVASGFTRRTFVVGSLGVGAGLALASCAPRPDFVDPSVSTDLPGTGRVTAVDLTAAPMTVDLGGVLAATWTFGSLPAPTIRVSAGDTVRVRLHNGLPEATSLHWHGVALRNDMDGVPMLTQDAVAPGADFTYEFVAPDPGTYWFHPHSGPQPDRGLYGALIVDDPAEPLGYDAEWVVMLDDWLDGVTGTPDDVLAELSGGMHGGMHGDEGGTHMSMGARSDLLGGDAGDVRYPHFVVNGRLPSDPEVLAARPGDRVRIRLINAASDTAFRVALGGHRLSVTHSDGFPVEPIDTDAVLLGMGERIDAIVTVGDGVFPLVAEAEGKDDRGVALLRTGGGEAPRDIRIRELNGSVLTGAALTGVAEATLDERAVDRNLEMVFAGSMMMGDWTINGRRFDHADPLAGALAVRDGERVRLTVRNDSGMWHPFHLHGHTYQQVEGGARKDTSIVLPHRTLVVEFDATNPGLWAAHCHNIYHAEMGMMAVLGYEA